MKSRIERGSQRTKYVAIDLNATEDLQDWIQNSGVKRTLEFAEKIEKRLGLKAFKEGSSHCTNDGR